jgi:hypothetical protein
MNIEKTAKETLRFLFSEYQKNPSIVYTINGVTDRHKIDAVELSDYLLKNDWIRERWIFKENVVGCRITIKGIEQIDPVYVRYKLGQVIGGLASAGGSKELLEILEFKIEEYAISLDLVRQLEKLGLVELHHPGNSIVIELTEEGWKFNEKGKHTFFTMMALS